MTKETLHSLGIWVVIIAIAILAIIYYKIAAVIGVLGVVYFGFIDKSDKEGNANSLFVIISVLIAAIGVLSGFFHS